MKMRNVLTLLVLLLSGVLSAQTSYYGMTSSGGASGEGTIFKTDSSGANLQTVFSFNYHQAGRNPQDVFTQASNGKIYGTTKFGGANLCSFPYFQYQRRSGVIFEYNPTNDNYTVLFNFDDTTTGCWPESAPVLASNGKLYGVTPSVGGFSQHYGTVYSFDLATGTYTKIHSFGQGSNDGENPVGNLLLASDGKLYGITSDGGFNDKGIIFTIDPTTDTYTKKLDLQNGWYGNKAAQDAKAGLIQAPNGKMYGTSESGGNYPPNYSYAYGNIFEYNPTTNVATNLYGFSNDSLGKNPKGTPVLVGTNDLYCITYQYYQIPGTYNQEPHYYLWKYSISSSTATVVDSIANGTFNFDMVLNNSGKIILTGKDYNISTAVRFWEFNPSTNTRTLIDTNVNLGYFYKGLMQASNGKYYAGGRYMNYEDGSFIEYNASNHTITEKFKFSEPVDGLNPLGDLIMATNGKFYGMTSKGGANNKGVVFEFNPSNNTYVKKFDLDSFSGYEPKGGLMEASNGKLYGLTYRGGNNGYGAIFEIDTTLWTLSKKASFNSVMGRPMGRMVEAWDGKLYGLTAWNNGTIFQYDIATASLVNKHSFTTNDGTSPYGSLAIADNGKLYGLTFYGGQSYYSHGTLFEYDPATSSFTMKKQLYNYTGYHSQGNTPTLGTDGKMYVIITTGGSGNSEYVGGAINEYIPGATTLTNKAVFSVSNTGSKPMGDLMESANGKFYGYTWTGGVNNKGTLFEYNPSTGVISKKVDFNGANGGLPEHGSLTESNTSAITITQQPTISSTCIGDTAYLKIVANHPTILHYQWYKSGVRLPGETNDTLSFIGLSMSDTGTYICKITGGAKAVVSTAFTLNPNNKPVVNITGLTNAYCLDNANITLTASPSGGTFSGAAVSGSVFSPSTAGVGNHSIYYSYTDANGCSNIDTANVNINALPNASFTGYLTSYCDNNSVDTLVPTTIGGTFTGTGITGNIFDPSFFASSSALIGFLKFKYTITDGNGCTNKDSVTVSIHHAPTVTLSGLNNTYCANDAMDTLVTSPVGGTITAGAFLNNTVFNPAMATIGNNTIYYTYTNSFNCTNSDTLDILVNAIPDATFTGLDSNYCVSDLADTLIPTTSGGIFSGDTTSVNIFNPSALNLINGAASVSQQIIYSITDNNGCFNADTLTTMVHALPVVTFGPLSNSFCNNDIPLLLLNNGSPNGGLYTGNGIIGNTFDPTAAGLGLDTLTYTYTDSNNCTNTDTAMTSIYPAPVFTLGNDTGMCINHTMTLTTGLDTSYIYLWNDGSTSSSLTINAATLGVGVHKISVVVKNSQTNCEEQDEINITVNACTGIEETSIENLISVYPNPSKGMFELKADIAIEQLEVYSSEGKLVYSQKLEHNIKATSLNLSTEVSGVYYLLIINGNDVIRKKIIIQR
jgi:uncharacterized repeat protein (TIGR03803 family)